MYYVASRNTRHYRVCFTLASLAVCLPVSVQVGQTSIRSIIHSGLMHISYTTTLPCALSFISLDACRLLCICLCLSDKGSTAVAVVRKPCARPAVWVSNQSFDDLTNLHSLRVHTSLSIHQSCLSSVCLCLCQRRVAIVKALLLLLYTRAFVLYLTRY